MTGEAMLTRARELVALEALLLDERDWPAWLALYEEDAVFWMPTWQDEDTLSSDPQAHLSFIHLRGRPALAERVRRIESGLSVASTPLPRTTHLVTSPRATLLDDGVRARVDSSWTCHVYAHKNGVLTTYAGRYEHRLVRRDEGWRIAAKKVVLSNDRLLSQADFFYF